MVFKFTVCLFQPHKQRLSLLQQRPPVLHHNNSSQPPPPCRRQLGSISGVARAKGTSRTRTGPPLSTTEVRPCCPHRLSRPTRVTNSLTPMDLTSKTPRVIAPFFLEQIVITIFLVVSGNYYPQQSGGFSPNQGLANPSQQGPQQNNANPSKNGQNQVKQNSLRKLGKNI